MKKLPTSILAAGCLLAVIILGGAGWYFWPHHTPALPVGLIVTRGSITGHEIKVAAKIAGRISAVYAREGSTVKNGHILAMLEPEQDKNPAGGKRSETTTAGRLAGPNQAGYPASASPEQISAAQAGLDKARDQLNQALSRAAATEKEYEKFKELFQQGIISSKELGKIKIKYDSAQAEADGAQQAVEAAAANLAAVQNSGVSGVKQPGQLNIGQPEIAGADQDLVVSAPADGQITFCGAEQGAIIDPSQVLFVMVDLHKLYIELPLPAAQLGQVHPGDEAQIYVDVFPDKIFSGQVVQINNQDAGSDSSRDNQPDRPVPGVEIAVENADGILQPGMAADVVIRWQNDVPWPKLR